MIFNDDEGVCYETSDAVELKGYHPQAKRLLEAGNFKAFFTYTDSNRGKWLLPAPYDLAISNSREAKKSAMNYYTENYGYKYITLHGTAFRKLSLIGSGAFANVYKCYQPNIDRMVAIKAIKIRKRGDKRTLEMDRTNIFNEITSLRLLRGKPGIAAISGIGEESEGDHTTIFLVFALCSSIGRFRIRTQKQFIQVLKHLLGILLILKENKIAHNDIKPGNFLLCDGKLVLTDFGLSRQVKEPFKLYAGTPSYIAPEIIRDKRRTYSADLWAMVATFYYFVYGHNTFRAMNRRDLFDVIKNFDYRLPDVDFLSERVMALWKKLCDRVFVVANVRIDAEEAVAIANEM